MITYLVTLLFPENMNKRTIKVKAYNFEKALRKTNRIKYFEEEIVSIIKEEF